MPPRSRVGPGRLRMLSSGDARDRPSHPRRRTARLLRGDVDGVPRTPGCRGDDRSLTTPHRPGPDLGGVRRSADLRHVPLVRHRDHRARPRTRPAAASSAVTVLPTHRRQGVLRRHGRGGAWRDQRPRRGDRVAQRLGVPDLWPVRLRLGVPRGHLDPRHACRRLPRRGHRTHGAAPDRRRDTRRDDRGIRRLAGAPAGRDPASSIALGHGTRAASDWPAKAVERVRRVPPRRRRRDRRVRALQHRGRRMEGAPAADHAPGRRSCTP